MSSQLVRNRRPSGRNAVLVLLRRFVTFGWFESFAVVAGFGLCLSVAAPVRPVQHVIRGGASGQDEFAEQTADFVAAERDQRGVCGLGFAVAAWMARVATRNAAASMARVMWAYQAS